MISNDYETAMSAAGEIAGRLDDVSEQLTLANLIAAPLALFTAEERAAIEQAIRAKVLGLPAVDRLLHPPAERTRHPWE